MIYIYKKRYYRLLLIGVFALLLILMLISTTIGAAKISFIDSLSILISKVPLLNLLVENKNIDATNSLIIFKIRLPRIVLSALSGVGLSMVGAAFQGIFRNPMADPYVMGTSAGASLGATLAIVAGTGTGISLLNVGYISTAAFIGSICSTFFVYIIARAGNRVPPATLILAGVAVNFLLSSLTSLIMIFDRQNIEKVVFWTMGSFATAGWNQVAIIAVVVLAGYIIINAYSRELNLITTGTDTARSLGVNVEMTKKVLLVVSSMITASIVSASGIIGFTGLVVPHMIRLILGSDHRVVIPFSALGGAVFMVICDTLARILIQPAEIPVGALTSLFGAPFFIYLLISGKKKVSL